MCQALGVSPLRKYQSDGGPGISDIMGVLSHSDSAEQDREQFFRAQIIFWLMAATDGHAKNFSIAIGPQSRYHLTPLYDVLSAWPVIGPGNNQIAWQKCKLAMAVHGSSNYYQIYRIQRRHWIHHGELTGLGRGHVESIMDDIISRTSGVIERVAASLPDSFPHQLADCIFEGIQRQCGRLAGKG